MIRILFVDDDENVLQAMRRAMHSKRHEWAMEFVMSGQAALDALAAAPADVIVSDMRMPGMDGWQVLAEVKRLYPQTVRLVLSGHAEPGAIMRLVGTAHQYLAKPGESEALRTAIQQTQLMRELLRDESLARIVGSVGNLPSLPEAFQQISRCLQGPDASVAEASAIIRRDVAMTANIMKLVNSAYFGARSAITSVDRAVAYLGLDTLTALVLGHGLFQSARRTPPDLWSHSFETAMACRALALVERLPGQRVDEAFLTGMLHDVGRVVMLNSDEGELEPHMHAQVGAYLLGLWGFPSHIVAAVAFHHTPSRRAGQGLDLTVLVHLADRLVRARDQPRGMSPQAMGIEPGLIESLELEDRLPRWQAAIQPAAGRERDS